MVHTPHSVLPRPAQSMDNSQGSHTFHHHSLSHIIYILHTHGSQHTTHTHTHTHRLIDDKAALAMNGTGTHDILMKFIGHLAIPIRAHLP